MLYFVCLLLGGAIGCMTASLLCHKDDVVEDLEQTYYKAMLDEGLSPRTAQRVEKRVRKEVGE